MKQHKLILATLEDLEGNALIDGEFESVLMYLSELYSIRTRTTLSIKTLERELIRMYEVDSAK